MRVPKSWLSEFLDLPANDQDLTTTLDELGLVVEAVEEVGAGLEAVVVARIDEVHAIKGADRIRLVVANAGEGPIEIVCGASNFEIGNMVPFAPVGAVLPGGFEIAQRTMRGVTSNGMLCSGRELALSDDQAGLMILDGIDGVQVGQKLTDLLSISPDVIFEISPEGNRPDAWSIEGVARDLAAKWQQSMRPVAVAAPNIDATTSSYATASIAAPELCGSLTVGVIRNVQVGPSPAWLQQRLAMAGMRAVNNVVDASNYVMLELGQPTHPYDAALVADRHLGVRQAREGEQLVTLDGVTRTLGQPGRGLGDTGIDCVIVDGRDDVIGLAGIMGGTSSEIIATTTDVLLEIAYFDPMTIARSVKRLGVRSEASRRFERGVDPTLAPRALARFAYLLQLSSPEMQWLVDPIEVRGELPTTPTISLTEVDIEALLGTAISLAAAVTLLRGIAFDVRVEQDTMYVTPSRARLDVRAGTGGRADIIEEIARLYGYHRLARRTPTWVQPGGLNDRQRLRRRVRDAVVGLGAIEAWTASLVTDDEFELTCPGQLRVRIANPLTADESVLRSSLLVGLARAWGRNVERGLGDVALFEVGTVVSHPGWGEHLRSSRGGVGGEEKVELPNEHEVMLVLLGRSNDDARTAVATWHALASRLNLRETVVRSGEAPTGWHPTRCAVIEDRSTGTVLGRVGEMDPAFVSLMAPAARDGQRVGLIQIDMDVLSDELSVRRRESAASIPSRYPSATIDLAFVTPNEVNASDVAQVLRNADALVEDVALFDVFRGASIADGNRSLAFALRLSAEDRTLSESEIATSRDRLIAAANAVGAQLR